MLAASPVYIDAFVAGPNSGPRPLRSPYRHQERRVVIARSIASSTTNGLRPAASGVRAGARAGDVCKGGPSFGPQPGTCWGRSGSRTYCRGLVPLRAIWPKIWQLGQERLVVPVHHDEGARARRVCAGPRRQALGEVRRAERDLVGLYWRTFAAGGHPMAVAGESFLGVVPVGVERASAAGGERQN